MVVDVVSVGFLDGARDVHGVVASEGPWGLRVGAVSGVVGLVLTGLELALVDEAAKGVVEASGGFDDADGGGGAPVDDGVVVAALPCSRETGAGGVVEGRLARVAELLGAEVLYHEEFLGVAEGVEMPNGGAIPSVSAGAEPGGVLGGVRGGRFGLVEIVLYFKSFFQPLDTWCINQMKKPQL